MAEQGVATPCSKREILWQKYQNDIATQSLRRNDKGVFMKRKGFLLCPGLREYSEMLGLQRRMNAARKRKTIPDTVIFLEHHPCITIGAQGKLESIVADRRLLEERGIKIYETDRGGNVTYHGPGQIVCYPIIDLNQYNCDVTTYARNLEEMIIRTLHAFGINSSRKEGYPGVWADSKGKIAAQGISINGWMTMHGVALNVSPSMEHFSFIIPCGIKEFEATSMAECLGRAVDLQAVQSEMICQFSALFKIELEEVSENKIRELVDREQA
ncbi:MAG: lipoyl(octanoyl) transferase LipB [Smithellaceae bacterium]|nr:lipoyl(octanoyl) transferase LipB [Smithellaceae bacterium]